MNRTYKQLTDTQRYQIEAWIKVGMPKEFIADQLGINRSTLYRELKRNSSKTGIYSKGVLWTELKKHNLYAMNARNASVEQGSSQKQRKRRSLNGLNKSNGHPNKSWGIAKNKEYPWSAMSVSINLLGKIRGKAESSINN